MVHGVLHAQGHDHENDHDAQRMESIESAILARFAYWSDIEIFVRGERLRSTGHGFCGIARRVFLNILQQRCERLGEFADDVPAADFERGGQLILGQLKRPR